MDSPKRMRLQFYIPYISLKDPCKNVYDSKRYISFNCHRIVEYFNKGSVSLI